MATRKSELTLAGRGPFILKTGDEYDVAQMNKMLKKTGVDIGGKMRFSEKETYYCAYRGDELVSFFALAWFPTLSIAGGAGLATHPEYRKLGLASSLMAFGMMEARHREVEWIGTTTMYYNWRFFTNRGWYSISRKDLFGPWKNYPEFVEKSNAMCFLRPIGPIAEACRAQKGLFPLPDLAKRTIKASDEKGDQLFEI